MTDLLAVLLTAGLFALFGALRRPNGRCGEASCDDCARPHLPRETHDVRP